MFNFFKRSGKPVEPDLSFIGIDMHSHLLPGIDDGLQELENSVAYIKDLKELGYHKLICTPHILSDLYPNSPQTILPKLALVRDALKAAGVDIQVEAAAEYMIDHMFSELLAKSKKEDLLTIAGDYILVEMSYLSPSPNFDQAIFDLRMMGLQPILAHPERYSYYHHEFEQYERFKDLGCKLQVNLLSLSGGYGPHVKKIAERLFKNEMVDFLGTDLHHDRHLAMLKSLATKKEFYDLVNGAEILNNTLIK
ncbi:tyrosine-protein phosphatase [Segetibacter aerophilus]|uniref:protein-tyrosine-phosphatase n=1 Tax=Segetibacter aerophilus TaxID=670293 RepID=A0A512BAP4_9BACT|nr:CpsB/CapC family capsule biosynthesis tyrosine phosphatase [Segetibacter aerophilus]GEO09036.1 capsular polysaccharide biosynthesis protein [Segetibacter aerophilus]